MSKMKTLTKAALGLALLGTVGIAGAGTLVEDSYVESALALDAKWTLTGSTGGSMLSISHDGTFWDVTSLGAGTGFYMSIPVWGTSVSAFHDEAPHAGDDPTGTTFSKVLAGTWPQTSTYTKTVSHPSQHADIYTFTAVASGTPGSGTEKVEIYLHAAHVPEPESYAMMLAGLGVLGAIARRRKARIG